MKQKTVIFRQGIFVALALFFITVQPGMADSKTIAFFPLVFHGDASKVFLQQGIQSMLISRLSAPGLKILDEKAISALSGDTDIEAIHSTQQAADLGKRLDVDYVLFGSITALAGSYSLDIAVLNLQVAKEEPRWLSKNTVEAELLSTVDELAAATRDIVVSDDLKAKQQKSVALAPVSAEPVLSGSRKGSADEDLFRPTQKAQLMEFEGALPVDMEILASDSGDLNGNGKLELVVLASNELLVYSRQGDGFILKKRMEASCGAEFLKVSVGDADGDGKEEIFLVSFSGARAISSVWNWDGDFQKLYEMKGHLRVTPSDASQNPVVLYQDSLPTGEGFFTGEIWKMSVIGSSLPKKEKHLILPEDAQFYTVVFFDIDGDGQDETLSLGQINIRERGALILSRVDGKILWQSRDTFGATNNIVDTESDEDIDYGGYLRIPLNPVPVVMDCDGDGQKEVVLATNLSPADFTTQKTVTKSYLSVFKVKNNELVPLWQSKKNPYPVLDLHTDKGMLFIATHTPQFFTWEKGSGKMLWFE